MSPAEASTHHADELLRYRSTKAAAEKEDFSGLYNFKQHNNNASHSSTDTTRHRGGASVAKSREMKQLTTKSTKRPFAQMSSTPRAESIPPLDIFLLRLSEKAPSAKDTTLRNGLQKNGQFLPAFEYCYRSGETISESDFFSTFALESAIGSIFRDAECKYDFFMQIGRRSPLKLEYSSDNFPQLMDWHRFARDCESKSSVVSSHRMIIVAPRSDNLQQRYLQNTCSSSVTSNICIISSNCLLINY